MMGASLFCCSTQREFDVRELNFEVLFTASRALEKQEKIKK